MTKRVYIYILLAFLLFILGRSCSIEQLNCSKVDNQIDTVITYKSDTIWAKNTTIVFKYKTIEKPVVVYLDKKKDTIRVYHDTLSDTNIVIMLKDTVKGHLLGQNVSYKLKVPIKIIDSVFVNIHEKELYVPKRKLFFGVNTQIYPLEPHIGPIMTYQDRKDRMYHINYDVMSGAVNVGFQTKISLKKKNN